MLSPSYLLHAVEPAEEIAEQLHIDIIRRIVERIVIRFQRGDDYVLTALDKWQIETLQEAGYLLEDIQKELAAATGKMQKEIAEAMEDAGVVALEYDDRIYRDAGLDPVPLVQSPYMIQLMQDTYTKTMGEWRNFTSVSKRAIHSLFVEACDTAYMQAMSGAISPSQAYLEALEKIVEGGVYVQYPGGRKDTIETATARAVRTGISQASARIQLARMDEMDVDLVLVSSHLGARPEHYVWQGKVYTRSGMDVRYPDFETVTGYGTVTGLCGANCRHNFSPYFEGMRNPFQEYDSEENQKQYELEQRQRTLERRIRKSKQEAMGWRATMDAETDPVKKAKAEEKYQKKAALLQQQNKAYNDFCEETGQKKRHDRIAVAKWNRSEAAKARAAAKKQNNKTIANEDSPRPIKKADYSVKWDAVQRDSYEKKFQTLSDSPVSNQAALVRAKWALNNRDGRNTEELYALDMRDGTEIARITDQNYPNGVKRTKQFDDRLYRAKSNGAKIMLIHNHPSGSPPSVGDFNGLLSIPDAYGITVGHDGSVYRYSAPKNKVLQSDFEVAILGYKRYSYNTAHEKALSEIAEKYGFTFERM